MMIFFKFPKLILNKIKIILKLIEVKPSNSEELSVDNMRKIFELQSALLYFINLEYESIILKEGDLYWTNAYHNILDALFDIKNISSYNKDYDTPEEFINYLLAEMKRKKKNSDNHKEFGVLIYTTIMYKMIKYSDKIGVKTSMTLSDIW